MDSNVPHILDDDPIATPRKHALNRDYSQIVIDGNARVHLGDQINQHGQGEQAQETVRGKNLRQDVFLKLAGITIELIEHLLILLRQSSQDSNCGAVESIKPIHLLLASNTIRSLVSDATLNSWIFNNGSIVVSESILQEAVHGASSLAQDIRHTLDNVETSVFELKNQTFGDLLEDASNDESSQKTRRLLHDLRSKTVLALLIQLK